jgi:hypothetical protein
MPGQHGQTYDPQEEPAPRSGWFRLEERPYPEQLDRAFHVDRRGEAHAVVENNSAGHVNALELMSREKLP